MPLRIGFDMDGVLADLSSAYREVEERLFAAPSEPRSLQPAPPSEQRAARRAGRSADNEGGEGRRRRDAIWRAIQETPEFWTTLKPVEPGAVRRIHQLMLQHRWEVFFITQRPATQGDTVQRQTQRWLMKQGFDVPSVLVINGSRGAAAGALGLSYHVDDSPQNCLDVMAEGRAKPILIVPSDQELTGQKARGLGIGVARTIGECLTILEQVSAYRDEPGVLQKVAAAVGWK